MSKLDTLIKELEIWVNWKTHPDIWYSEIVIFQAKGWTHVTVNAKHNPITVIYWLKSEKAIFKVDGDEFLIKDEKCAILAILKFG